MSRRRPTLLVYHPDEAARYAGLVQAPRGALTVHVASSAEEAQPAIAGADIVYGWLLPAALWEKAGRVAWLQAMGAGVDWALGPELPPRVTVTRAPGVFGPWMAEYVVGWCSWITQRAETYREAQRRRQWIDVLPDRLRGKTMAIVGMGDVGRAIARAVRALGVRVIGVSRSGRRVPEAERVYPARRLGAALAAADLVVLAVPLTAETRGLVGAPELAAMRPAAWLVNVARGAVVEEAALVEALRARRIAGAVLDVFAAEPLPPEHPLWTLDNVVVTPHIAGPSTAEEIAPIFNDNLARWRAGRPLRHVVDRARGY